MIVFEKFIVVYGVIVVNFLIVIVKFIVVFFIGSLVMVLEGVYLLVDIGN